MTTTFPFDRSPAFQTFLQTIDAAQCRGMSEDTMEDLLDATLTRLDQQWETLEQLAHMGLEAPLTALLDVLLREWSVKEALALLLREAGTYVDPTDAGLQTAFWDKLARQHGVALRDVYLQAQRAYLEQAVHK